MHNNISNYNFVILFYFKGRVTDTHTHTQSESERQSENFHLGILPNWLPQQWLWHIEARSQDFLHFPCGCRHQVLLGHPLWFSHQQRAISEIEQPRLKPVLIQDAEGSLTPVATVLATPTIIKKKIFSYHLCVISHRLK